MPTFEIDKDIRKAFTLPSSFYTDERFFELSKERIFSRSWQLAARSDEIANLKPVSLLEGSLDEPLILVKNEQGSISALSNVCTHRGKILVENPCSANLIRCGYHGRRFDLQGKFLSMPEFEGVEDFPTERDDLCRIPTADLGDFIFVSLKPAFPFDEIRAEISEHFRDTGTSRIRVGSIRDYEVAAHWALYCENYLEGFHIPYVHHSLNEVLDYGAYTTETLRYSSVQTGYDENGSVVARYLFIFPNTMFNFYPWGISVNIVKPRTPSSTRVTFLTYISDDSKLSTGAGADLHDVELEDEAVVESVQKGIRSRFYDRGRYSPSREQGTHHFHRLIAEFME
jgi:choline monooxygenase